MYISRFKLRTIKAFTLLKFRYLQFNVVVGQNDAGKTAFIEALGLQFNN
jgi:AAA15 family ATPase/GTPase